LRFYNRYFAIDIEPESEPQNRLQLRNPDSLVYLEEEIIKKKDDKLFISISRTIKNFNFEKDYELCRMCIKLLHNIIETRKFYYNKKLHGKEIVLFTFDEIDKDNCFYSTINQPVIKSYIVRE